MIMFIKTSLMMVLGIVSVQALDAPDNNSHQHWSLRTTAGSSNPAAAAAAPSNSDSDIYTLLSTLVERVESLEKETKAQASQIDALQSKLDKADSSLHRFLQTSDADCLPKLTDSSNGPRCDFQLVTRFQDHVFFNDDVTFNENVEFDTDADCMPIFNATTKQCTMRNNFTYDADVEFRNKTYFTKDSYVKFDKKTIFEDDVYIQNPHKDINFVVDDKVIVKFQPDYDIHFYKETTFHKDVSMKEDLDVDGHTYLDGTEVDGDLTVKGESNLHKRVYANDGITAKDGIEIKTGKLDIKEGGAHIYGHVTMADNLLVKGDLEVLGAQIYSGDVVIDGKLTVNNGARINTMHTDPALYVDGKSNFRNDMDVSKKIVAGALDLDGENGKYLVPLYVKGDGKFDGMVTASNFDFHAPTEAPVVPGDTINFNIENLMVEISKRVLIVKNLYIDTEDPDNEVLNLGRLRSRSVKVQSIEADTAMVAGKTVDPDGGDTPEGLVSKLGQFGGVVTMNAVETKSLMVEGTAMVGQEEILTTADADAMASSSAAASAPAGCSCSADDMKNVITGDYIRGEVEGRSVTFDSVSVVTSSDPYTTERLTPGGGGGGSNECTCSDSQIESVVSGMTGLNCDCPAPTVVEDNSSTCDCPDPMTSDMVRSIVADETSAFITSCDCDVTEVTVCGCTDELDDYVKSSDLDGYARSSDLDGFLTECPCE